MSILLIFLVAGSWLPSNSYEMGHYAPGFISFEIGYQTTQLAYDIFWYKANPINRDWICFWSGVGTSIISYYLISKHYKTENEKAWYHLGQGHAMGFHMMLTIIRIPLHKRNEKNKYRAFLETIRIGEI